MTLGVLWSPVLAMLLVSADEDAQVFRIEPEVTGPIVLGEVEQVPVKIVAPETQENASRPLRVSVNVGHFDPAERLAAGVYRSTFHLPKTRHPQAALIAVWRETGPDARIDFLRIPLYGRTTVPIRTQPGAEVSVLVEEAVFGPVVADRRGRASVPIIVPPGVREVISTSRTASSESQARVDANVPPYNRLTLAVTPYLVSADGRSSATVHVYYDVDAPPPIAKVKLSGRGGSVRALGSEGNRFRFRFVPDRSSERRSTEIRARVHRDRTSSASAILTLGTPEPHALVLKNVPEGLVADGRSSVAVSVLVLDRFGLGIDGHTVTATSAHAHVTDLRPMGKGEYRGTLTASDRYPVGGKVALAVHSSEATTLQARFEIPVQPGPWPEHAEIRVEPSLPLADGESSLSVLVHAVDAAGADWLQGGIRLMANGREIQRVEPLGGGVYRFSLTAPYRDDALELQVLDATERLRETSVVHLRVPPRRLSLGARAGVVFNAKPRLALGLELGARLPWDSRRLRAGLAVEYREERARFQSSEIVEGVVARYDAKLSLLPVVLFITRDVYESHLWTAYIGGRVALIGYRNRTQRDALEPKVRSGFGFGGGIIGGVEVEGFLLEVGGEYFAVSSPDFERGAWGAAVTLGYRLGLW